MAKRKRAQSDVSDSGSSYKQEDSDAEESESPSEQPRTRASTSKEVQTTSLASEARGSVQSPGKLLAAMSSLGNQPLSTPNSSPRKRARRVSPILEPKEGRVSDVPSHLEITKGNAQKLFRLTAADLNDSDLKFREMSRGSLKGHMHLYNMRAVERLAWKKYGSPEKFDAVLDKAQALWISKGKDPHAFPRVPRPFRPYTRGKCKQCNSLFSMPSHVIFDKCDRCRGVIPKATVRRDLFDGLMDYEDMDPGEYNEDQLDHYGGGCACCDFFGLA